MSVQGSRRAKHKTFIPLDDHWVILSSSKAFEYVRTRRDVVPEIHPQLNILVYLNRNILLEAQSVLNRS